MFGRRRKPPAPDSEIYTGLRGQALSLDPAELGMHPTDVHPRVFGAMMEVGMPGHHFTLVGFVDGTTSLYLSTGGGFIGGGGDAAVAAETVRFLAVAEACLDQLAPSSDAALPAEGQVILRALGYEGPRSVTATDAQLQERRHPLSPLYYAAHDVMTQLRLVDEQRSRGS